jgi:protein-S-isoprenylcysteine O-methyltransferase Ste14
MTTTPQPVASRSILPPHWFLIALGVELALNRWLPVVVWVPGPLRALGGGVVVAGVCLTLWAFSLFRRARTGIKPFSESTSLVVAGPYRFTRNPMYLGLTVTLLGSAVIMGALTPFVAPILFAVVITTRFIRFEEVQMERTFGNSYLGWKKRVRRWL